MKDIVSRTPVNKTAALVTGRGIHYRPDIKIQTADQSTPIPICKKSELDRHIGKRRGRLVVLGKARDKKRRLVCRCDCGTYTIRTTKAMNNPANYGDRCEVCRNLAFLKKSDIYRRTGKDVDVRTL